jgi:hypothetical protein
LPFRDGNFRSPPGHGSALPSTLCKEVVFEADDLTTRLTILRALVRGAAGKDASALTLLLEMLPAIDALLADVQAALGQRS